MGDARLVERLGPKYRHRKSEEVFAVFALIKIYKIMFWIDEYCLGEMGNIY